MAEWASPAGMRWDGPEFALHLRMVGDAIVPFHGEAMLDGLISVKVEQELGDLTRVTIECYVEPAPSLHDGSFEEWRRRQPSEPASADAQQFRDPIVPVQETASVVVEDEIVEPAPRDDDDGWIGWAGGTIPVEFSDHVVVRTRDGTEKEILSAGSVRWWHDEEPCNADIVAYRVLP